jgi:hypothetical protein
MNRAADNNRQDRELWQRLRRLEAPTVVAVEAIEAADPVDANDLAAYLDGTADAGPVEHLEDRMLRDPQLLEQVLELRGLAGSAALSVPRRVLVRAEALVGGAAGERAGSGLAEWIGAILTGTALRWRPGVGWAAAAAVVLAAWLAGFASGHGAFNHQWLVEQRSQPLRLLDAAGSDADPLLLLAGPNGGGGGGP